MWYALGETTKAIAYPAYASYGTAVTASSSANTKGTAATVVSTVPFDSYMFVMPCVESASGMSCLYDVMVETTVVWANLCHAVGASTGYRCFFDNVWHFPTIVPKGSAVKMQLQSTTGSAYIQFKVMLMPITHQSLAYHGAVFTIGADTTDSEGTVVDPGTSADTKGSWVVLTASTTHPFKAFRLGFTTNGNNYTTSGADRRFDVAIGATGSEQIIVEDIYVWHSGVREKMTPTCTPIYPIPIPEGTQIQVRQKCSITDATDRLSDVIFYGIA